MSPVNSPYSRWSTHVTREQRAAGNHVVLENHYTSSNTAHRCAKCSARTDSPGCFCWACLEVVELRP